MQELGLELFLSSLLSSAQTTSVLYHFWIFFCVQC